jgi:hypothetical protein
MTFEDRLRGALWGMFVGAALAMPVYWCYDVAALQQRVQPVRAIQRGQVIASADMNLADENLRHGAASGARNHDCQLVRFAVDRNFLQVADALAIQQPFRPPAERTKLGAVHRHFGHGWLLVGIGI